MKYAGAGTRVLLDQYHLSGFLASSGIDFTQETIKVDCYSDTGPRRLVGNYDHTLAHTGYFDAATGAMDPMLFASLADNAEHYGLITFGGIGTTVPAEGAIGYEQIGVMAGRPMSAPIGAAIAQDFSMDGSQGASRVAVLRSGTISGNGNGTGQNVGITTSPTTLQVVFRIISGTFTACTFTVEQSSDNGAGDAYAAVASLTSGNMTAAGIVRVTTAATTEAWKRVAVSGWAGTSLVAVVTIGTVQGT